MVKTALEKLTNNGWKFDKEFGEEFTIYKKGINRLVYNKRESEIALIYEKEDDSVTLCGGF